jgi:hypothetical protein
MGWPNSDNLTYAAMFQLGNRKILILSGIFKFMITTKFLYILNLASI